MFNVLAQINWIAVLVTTVALSVLGGLWFTLFFPKYYAISLGREAAPKQQLAPIYYVGPLVCGLVLTIASAVLIRVLRIESFEDSLVFGAIVGFGYLVSTTFNVAINPNIPRPLLYGLVSGGYFFVISLVVSLVQVFMR